MGLLTQEFQSGKTLGKVRRANESLDRFDRAVYENKLYKLYGHAQAAVATALSFNSDNTVDMQANAVLQPEVQAAFTIWTEIAAFVAVAPRITELHAEELKRWPNSRANPEQIDVAFRLWVSDKDLQQAVLDAMKALDMPNGQVLAPIEQLTEEQRADPFLSNNGNKPSTS